MVLSKGTTFPIIHTRNRLKIEPESSQKNMLKFVEYHDMLEIKRNGISMIVIESTSPLHWVSTGCASFGYLQLPFPPTSLQSDSKNDPVTPQDSGQQRFMSFAQLVHHFVEDEQVYLLQFFPDAFRHASESFALHKSEY